MCDTVNLTTDLKEKDIHDDMKEEDIHDDMYQCERTSNIQQIAIQQIEILFFFYADIQCLEHVIHSALESNISKGQ